MSRRAGAAERVGGEPGEIGGVAGAVQVLEAEVVFVVADRHGVIAEEVHGEHHRVGGERGGGLQAERAGAGPGDRLVDEFERRALDGVAAVDQEGVGIFRPGRADQRRDFGKPARGGLVRDVVDGVQIAVQVGRREHRNPDLLGLRESGEREERREPHRYCFFAGAGAGSRLLGGEPERRSWWRGAAFLAGGAAGRSGKMMTADLMLSSCGKFLSR